MVKPDDSLAGTESEPQSVLWQIRMIIWEWLNRTGNGEWISCCSITEKGDLLAVFEPDASLSDKESGPTGILFRLNDSRSVGTGCFIDWNGEWTRYCRSCFVTGEGEVTYWKYMNLMLP
jgi:hypothetical protein